MQYDDAILNKPDVITMLEIKKRILLVGGLKLLHTTVTSKTTLWDNLFLCVIMVPVFCIALW